jgi:hypothetical protein
MLPPGYHSQQAGTILPTLMLVPPAVPPMPPKTEMLYVGTAAIGCPSSASRLLRGLRRQSMHSRSFAIPQELQNARMIENSFSERD